MPSPNVITLPGKVQQQEPFLQQFVSPFLSKMIDYSSTGVKKKEDVFRESVMETECRHLFNK